MSFLFLSHLLITKPVQGVQLQAVESRRLGCGTRGFATQDPSAHLRDVERDLARGLAIVSVGRKSQPLTTLCPHSQGLGHALCHALCCRPPALEQVEGKAAQK